MKQKILLILFFIVNLSYSQIPTDDVMRYSFVNSSLVNKVNPGVGNLTQSGSSAVFTTGIEQALSSGLDVNTDSFTGGATGSGTLLSNFTFSFWVKLDGVVDNTEKIICKINTANGTEYEFRVHVTVSNNPAVLFTWFASGGGASTGRQSIIPLNDGEWHHIVFIREPDSTSSNDKFTSYLDGVQSNLITTSSDLITPTINRIDSPALTISPNKDYKREIDNIRFYERSITQAEAEALYNEGGIVNIPDTNFKSYLIGNTSINTNNDNEIQVTEATNFNGALLPIGRGVLDWTGIEAFPNVTELFADSNPSTSLNLFNNSALTTLFFEEAFSLNSLVLPDPNNNSLRLVAITDAANLPAFDPSVYPNLERYGCHECITTGVDFSNNLNLEVVELGETNIQFLDLSIQTALIYVSVRNCQQLQAMDISNGNNSNISQFNYNSQLTLNLTCIAVDNVAYANNTFSQRDAANVFTTTCSLLSAENFDFENNLSIYPNPTSSLLNIDMKSQFKNVVIYSVLGNKVLQSSSKSINTSQLKNGVYLIKIEDENGNISTKRFIKQ